MIRRLLVTTALLTAAGSALAADLPARVAAPAPFAAAPIFTWTGFYVGATAGYGWGKQTLESVSSMGVSNACPGDCDLSLRGANVGATVGVNYQMGAIVLGLESDISWSGLKGSRDAGVLGGGGGGSYRGKVESFGTARMRVGYAIDRFLPYVTGGLYWQKAKASLDMGLGSMSDTDTSVGWTLGAGVEYALMNHWSLKGEYLYARTNDVTFDIANGLSLQTKGHQNILRAGVNYRF